MKIDLHIHSREGSDGRMTLPEIFEEACRRNIKLISITDHDSIESQNSAQSLAAEYNIQYITGVEMNISFFHPRYTAKPVSLDILGYQFDISSRALSKKLFELREHRRRRAESILLKINEELVIRGINPFTEADLRAIEETADGSLGRPHIADYMIRKNIVATRQAAFDKYLVKCDVPKMPVSLEEASTLIRGAGGRTVLAHPNNQKGTSLVSITSVLQKQFEIIKEAMLPYLDGVECWHPSHDAGTVSAYLEFAEKESLMLTGGSDCHQHPVIMGTVPVPYYVAEQFG
ncbi:MAG: PHP domain-containing protein [Deltaproteobacteria bacterium]|nr:PHP domain-containing protein [Deltaproteobacteria bacterium]